MRWMLMSERNVLLVAYGIAACPTGQIFRHEEEHSRRAVEECRMHTQELDKVVDPRQDVTGYV